MSLRFFLLLSFFILLAVRPSYALILTFAVLFAPFLLFMIYFLSAYVLSLIVLLAYYAWRSLNPLPTFVVVEERRNGRKRLG